MSRKRFFSRLARKYQKSPFYLQLPLMLLLQAALLWFAIHDKIKLMRKALSRIQKRRQKIALTKLKQKQKKQRKTTKTIPFILRKRFIIICLCALLLSALVIFLPRLLSDLPNPNTLRTRQIPQTTHIYDRKGVLLYQIYANQNRTIIPLSEIPVSLQEATLAIEDKNFYHHPGFDLPAIFRAFNSNLHGKSTQGASTITQQLIKSSYFSPEKNLLRKIKEVILAFWTERIYSKEEILTMYFNQIPYGGTAWGVEAAAQVYFGKQAKKLTLAESAFLAGITQAPSTYSPYGQNPTLWQQRQKEVLDNMVELNFITRDEKKRALEEKLVFRKPETPLYAPHFVMYVRDLLIKRYGLAAVEKGGLNVITTLDLSLQNKAQEIVAKEVTNSAYLNLTNGAALITNPYTGDIYVMVGSHDYNDPANGNFNVTTSLRQPGSSIKVVTYAAALENGLTAASLIDDNPITFNIPGSESYSPVNYDGRYHGRVTLRQALANSYNIPAVKTLSQVGIAKMVSLGRAMGISSWDDSRYYGLATTLGGAETSMLDMTTVFGTLANEGLKVKPNPILKITDAKGNILEDKESQKVIPNRVLSDSTAFIISDILSDNIARTPAFGWNSPLTIPGRTVSVKTGTTDNKRDNWTIGYTPEYVVTVWVGNNDNTPMSPSLTSGITGAAPIWHTLMETLLASRPELKPVKPASVIQKFCNGRVEYFVSGTENNAGCYTFPSNFPGRDFFRR